ncbi:MAG TPA: hypothetical protein VMU77_00060, partial [Acidimicrobiales bacterium]|nr:hypothetical protein [Acidimicrobiales bacterium]
MKTVTVLISIAALLFVASCSAGTASPQKRIDQTSPPTNAKSPGSRCALTAHNGFASPMCGFTLGVDLSPINLLPGLPQSQNPTGTSLITLMEEDHIRLIRLVGDAPGPVPVLMGMLHSGGWKTIFTELDSARIGVVLNLGGETAPNGTFDGDWSADPLQVPSSQAPEPTAQWISNEAGIIEDIKSQCDGVPPSLVAVEMANEPLLNPTTLPMIGQALAAIRSELPGIAVTVGGWRAPAIKAGTFWDYNDPADTGEIAPLVDYVSAHLYP